MHNVADCLEWMSAATEHSTEKDEVIAALTHANRSTLPGYDTSNSSSTGDSKKNTQKAPSVGPVELFGWNPLTKRPQCVASVLTAKDRTVLVTGPVLDSWLSRVEALKIAMETVNNVVRIGNIIIETP